MIKMNVPIRTLCDFYKLNLASRFPFIPRGLDLIFLFRNTWLNFRFFAIQEECGGGQSKLFYSAIL